MFIENFFSRSLSNFFEGFVDRLRMTIILWKRQLQPVDDKAVPAGPITVSAFNEPDPSFIKLVEDGLRKLPDFIALGRSPLTDCVGMKGDSHILRGKQLYELLCAGIESLRPAGTRPVSAPPRDWYNFIILHDAYVVGLRNRDVMARLYISEGTFNRTRRNAVRGVAMWLIEGMRQNEN